MKIKKIIAFLCVFSMIFSTTATFATEVTVENIVGTENIVSNNEENTEQEPIIVSANGEEAIEQETTDETTEVITELAEEHVLDVATEEVTVDENEVNEELEMFAETSSSWVTAPQLIAGAKTAFNLPSSGSVAWFRIDVENDDEAIKLSFDGFDSTSNYIYVRLYKGVDLENNSNASYFQRMGTFKTDMTRTYKVPEAGSYYVNVILDNNNNVLENDVNISYTIVAPDSYECNDTWENATELIQDVDSSYTLNGQNDVDWFKITVANDTDAIKLVMSNFDYTVKRVSYYLYRGTDLEVGKTNYIDSYTGFYTNMSRNFKVNEAGDYYVKIVMYESGSEWNEKALKIRYEIVDGDANENNETKENATYLTDSVPMEFTMTGHNDVEWFCFDTTMENETVTLTIDGFETDYSNQINIYLYDGNTENTVFRASPNSYYTRTASFINVGTKYIKISVCDGKISENPLKITYSGGTGKKDFNEANNTWQTATPLTKDSELQFNLPADTDSDWFVFDVDNPDEAVELSFTGFEPSSAAVCYSFYSGEDLNKYGNNANSLYYSYGFSQAFNRKYKVTEPGKYYINVRLYNGGTSITEYLTVKYSAIEPDKNENNDTWKNATLLEQDVDMPYTIHGYNDIDWFKINVKNPDEAIQFNFTGFKVDTNAIHVAMYSEEDFMKYGNNTGSFDYVSSIRRAYSRHYKVKNPGNYYVRISSYDSYATIEEPLAVSYNIIEPDEHEYNDTWKTATTLQEDINKAFTLTGHNDIDWFKITANKDESIKLTFDGFETNGGHIWYNFYSGEDFKMYGDSASNLYYRNNVHNFYGNSYKVPETGDYYVRVGLYSYSDYGIIDKPITIKYSIEAPDYHETSDSYDNAIKPNINQTVYHTINGWNDRDYFRIDNITAGDTINVYTGGYGNTDTHKAGSWDLYYYNAETEGYENKTWGRMYNESQTHKYTATADGTYYFVAGSYDTNTPLTNTRTFRYTISRENAPVQNIKLNYESITLNEGVNTTLVASFTPLYATNQNLTWTSTNSNVVSVDSYGNISCLAVGQATIKAISEDGGYISSCLVTVAPAIRVSSITLDKEEAIVAYEGSIQLNATINPEDATNQKVIWTSSDEEVAVVNTKGKVTGVGHGEAVITAKTEDGGFEAKCSVRVPEYSTAVRAVSINTNAATMYLGDDMQFEAIITPSNATNTNVSWKSADSSIVSIDKNGKATAKGLGTTTITVTTEEGGYTNTCTVVVEPQPIKVTGISLSAEALTLAIPGTNTLVATVTPYDATDKTIKWSSSNAAVATVSSSGKVTAVGLGTATITATTQDGGFKAECIVTVSTTALKGDVNYDGDIDAADALIVLKSDVKLTTLTTAQKKIADANGDGVVDAADAILILKCNAGLIDSLE